MQCCDNLYRNDMNVSDIQSCKTLDTIHANMPEKVPGYKMDESFFVFTTERIRPDLQSSLVTQKYWLFRMVGQKVGRLVGRLVGWRVVWLWLYVSERPAWLPSRTGGTPSWSAPAPPRSAASPEQRSEISIIQGRTGCSPSSSRWVCEAWFWTRYSSGEGKL